MKTPKTSGAEIAAAEAADTPAVLVDSSTYVIRPCGELVNVNSMSAMRNALELASSTPGAQRAAFMAALKTVNAVELGIPAVTIRYGSSSVSVSADLSVVSSDPSKAGSSRHPPGVHNLLSTSAPGAAPANKKVDGVVIPCGVCLIVAGGGTGKTPLAHTLASAGVESYSVVRVGEPLAGYSSSDESVAFSIAAAMLTSSDIVLDSIKDLLSSGGAAMKSGLSRDALVTISGWAAAACEAGCTIYVPVNPSTPDSEVLNLLIEAAKSNATMTVASTGGSAWSYSSRKGESLKRNAGTMTFTYDARTGLGKVKLSNGGETQNGGEEIAKLVASVVSYNALSSSMRRAIVNQN